MSPTAAKVDRAALVRRALVELVAENGFRGTSMSAVAERAGVATGTAYVHYESKDDLVLAAYVEVKTELANSTRTVAAEHPTVGAMFVANWHAMYSHLAADPVRARFLVQVEASPYALDAHAAALAQGVMLDLPGIAELFDAFVDLPGAVLWDMSMGPAIRAAAAETELTKAELDTLAAACWRAVSRPA